MNKTTPLVAALVVSALLGPFFVRAQSAPLISGATSVDESDETIVLSPFMISSASDKGYAAENTLAGTRLKSNLTNVAASVSVVTKQQLIDTGAINLNDVFLYEANTEGLGNYTDVVLDPRGGVQDNAAGYSNGTSNFGPATANRVRGLGRADTARDYYTTIARLPFDSYNTDSVTISRGPNSVLFGLGGAAGITNQSAARALLGKELTQISLRVGSWDAFRTSLDVNRPLIARKLAIRVAALYDAQGFQRQPAYDITRRQYGALTFRPLEKTTLRASFENYSNSNRRPNSITPRDLVTPWIQAGRPSWDPTTATATVNGVTSARITNDLLLPPGLMGLDYTRPAFFIDQGNSVLYTQRQLGDNTTNPATPWLVGVGNANQPERMLASGSIYTQFRNSAPAGQPSYPLFTAPGVTDKSIYDWERININSGNVGKDKAQIYNVELEQQLAPDLFLQLGWYREDFKSYSRYYIGQLTGTTIYIDPNTKLLDGSSNPFFGRPFIEIASPDDISTPEVNETARATLAYKLDFTERPDWTHWLGRHDFMGLLENRTDDSAALRYREVVVSNHAWTNSANIQSIPGAPTTSLAQNNIHRRFYLGGTDGRVAYDPGEYFNAARTASLRNFNWTAQQWVDEPVRLDNTLHFVSNKSQQAVSSRAVAMQNFLWDDRIVTTFGWRRDKNSVRTTPNLTLDPATGLPSLANLNNFGDWQVSSGNTRTAGAVIKPLRWLSFHYNKSDNFSPVARGFDFYGNNLPNPTGEGKDYGIGFQLFDNKLVARLNFFDVTQAGSRNGAANTFVGRTARIDQQYFTTWATRVAQARLPGASNAEIAAETARITQLPAGFQGEVTGLSSTTNFESKGVELQLTYNPMPNWTMKFNVAQQKAKEFSSAPEMTRWLAQRLPIWQAATDQNGVPFWTTINAGDIGATITPEQWYFQNVASGMQIVRVLEGKPRPQEREWRGNFLSNYRFTTGRLKNFGLGGGLRYEDAAAIGFLGSPDPDGTIRTLDVSREVRDNAETHLDFWLSYNFRLFSDKVRTTLQLNVRDALENGGLRPIGANPDGTLNAYRIIDSRQWFLTATFDL